MSLLREMKNVRSRFSPGGEEALLNLLFNAALLDGFADRLLHPFGLTRSQFNILMTLEHEGKGGMAQHELATRRVVTAANVSVVLKGLEAKGLIARRHRDLRTKIVQLTRAARVLLQRVEPLYDREVLRLLGSLTVREQRVLTCLLEKMRGPWLRVALA